MIITNVNSLKYSYLDFHAYLCSELSEVFISGFPFLSLFWAKQVGGGSQSWTAMLGGAPESLSGCLQWKGKRCYETKSLKSLRQQMF